MEEAPDTVSSAVAVPFFATFPMVKSDGTGYLSEVHVYPKNVQGDIPKPGKDVEKIGNDDGSYKIGDDIDFILKGSIPSNIQDYETYNLVDTFDSQLTPNTTDVTEQDKPTKKKVTVKLTDAGIQKLATVDLAKRDVAVVDGQNETANSADAPFV